MRGRVQSPTRARHEKKARDTSKIVVKSLHFGNLGNLRQPSLKRLILAAAKEAAQNPHDVIGHRSVAVLIEQ